MYDLAATRSAILFHCIGERRQTSLRQLTVTLRSPLRFGPIACWVRQKVNMTNESHTSHSSARKNT